MKEKFNFYSILDAKKLIKQSVIKDDEQKKYKFKKVNHKQKDIFMLSKKSFKAYDEVYETRIIGRIRKRQVRYKDYKNYDELVTKKTNKNIIGKCKLTLNDNKSKNYDIRKKANRHIVGYAWIGEDKFLEVTTFNPIWLLIPIILAIIIAIGFNFYPQGDNPFKVADSTGIENQDNGSNIQDYPLCYYIPFSETITLTNDNRYIKMANVKENAENYYISYEIYVDNQPILDEEGNTYSTGAIEPGQQVKYDLWSKLDKGTYMLSCKATEYDYKTKEQMYITYELTTTINVVK